MASGGRSGYVGESRIQVSTCAETRQRGSKGKQTSTFRAGPDAPEADGGRPRALRRGRDGRGRVARAALVRSPQGPAVGDEAEARVLSGTA